MKTMQKIMIALALLGSFALPTPAQAGQSSACHRYHHYGCHRNYRCWHHYGYWHPYVCRPRYGCWHHHRHCG